MNQSLHHHHHPLMASNIASSTTAQVVSSIVEAGVSHMNNSSSIPPPRILSPSEPPTNTIINLLSTSNREGFQTTNAGHISIANEQHSLLLPQTQLTPTQSVDTLEHENKPGILLPQTQRSGGDGTHGILYNTSENPARNNNSSPTEKLEHSKNESLENGGNDHSPKYISL